VGSGTNKRKAAGKRQDCQWTDVCARSTRVRRRRLIRVASLHGSVGGPHLVSSLNPTQSIDRWDSKCTAQTQAPTMAMPLCAASVQRRAASACPGSSWVEAARRSPRLHNQPSRCRVRQAGLLPCCSPGRRAPGSSYVHQVCAVAEFVASKLSSGGPLQGGRLGDPLEEAELEEVSACTSLHTDASCTSLARRQRAPLLLGTFNQAWAAAAMKWLSDVPFILRGRMSCCSGKRHALATPPAYPCLRRQQRWGDRLIGSVWVGGGP
jgi:hypothetical protein